MHPSGSGSRRTSPARPSPVGAGRKRDEVGALAHDDGSGRVERVDERRVGAGAMAGVRTDPNVVGRSAVGLDDLDR
jgi:hypothetical protein